ncbi:hypothetical protein [Flexivirga endophytica]|nr:hypothetical protein [Flexivirga endophytica]
MKSRYLVAGSVAGAAGLLGLSQRLALHRRLIPRLTSRINTQVHRINQP